MAKKSNKFVVDLGGVALADDDRRRVAAAIQSAVLQFLASHTKTPRSEVTLMDEGGIAGMFVPEPEPPALPSPDKGRKR